MWITFFLIGTCFLLASIVLAFVRSKMRYKSGRLFEPFNILLIGVAGASILLFIPIYIHTFRGIDCGIFETILISIHNMIRLFLVDGEFSVVTANWGVMPEWIFRGYSIVLSTLFVLAPVLTFNFVLSFFKNISAYKRYFTHYHADVFIFSDLNEKSLALAKSLESNQTKKRLFIFTDVFAKNEEESYELIERAKELNAICFKKDITTVDFSFHSKKSDLNFFIIGEDYSENISQSLSVVETYQYRENTNLYVFSTLVESEILLSNAFVSHDTSRMMQIKVRRINEVQSLIMRNLYENGYEQIFENAYDDGSGVKRINAVILGMGRHGIEMTKALAWFCQMDGYELRLDVFDAQDNVAERFTALCPELMAMSGKTDIPGEARYTICIHPGIDARDITFDKLVGSLPRTTYALVATGDDERNISFAVKLRSLFAGMGYDPKIQAIVYRTDKKQALKGVTNFKKQAYDVDYIGDIETSYSEAVILNSDVERKALARHLKWGQERDFWQYDYNYKSSVASAIHRDMKQRCGIPGIEKDPSQRTDEELWNIRVLEHCRWNAYMRSEGYVYSGSLDPSTRNDLAKKHHCLVPFEQLPLKEQEKDDD